MTAVTAISEITFLVPSESALRAVILTRHRGIRRVGQLRCYRRIDNITFSPDIQSSRYNVATVIDQC